MSARYYPHFTLDLPAGWSDETVATFVGKRVNNFQTNIVISRVIQGERLGVERHAQKQLDLIRGALADYEVHEEASITFSGERAYRVVHSFDSGDGRKVKQLQLYVEKDGHVLSITCSAEMAAFAGQLPDFESILGGLELS